MKRMITFFALAILLAGCGSSRKVAKTSEAQKPVDGLAAALKGCAPAAGFREVLLPGEPERRTEKKRRLEGIPIDEETWHQVTEAAASLGVPAPAV